MAAGAPDPLGLGFQSWGTHTAPCAGRANPPGLGAGLLCRAPGLGKEEPVAVCFLFSGKDKFTSFYFAFLSVADTSSRRKVSGA